MMIPIEGFDLTELLETLKAFPNGKVQTENNKPYWNTTDRIPKIQVQQVNQPQPQMQQKKSNAFGNMKNALFEAFD